MGRTVPTYRRTLESIIREWGDFRRALDREDREAFDKVMARARKHSSASSYAALCDPLEAVLLSILLEQEKEIESLRKGDE
jgi:hypothetical protein